MIREFRVQRSPAGRTPAPVDFRPCRLSRVWVETGNPHQPLASVWVDGALHGISDLGDSADRDPWPLCA